MANTVFLSNGLKFRVTDCDCMRSRFSCSGHSSCKSLQHSYPHLSWFSENAAFDPPLVGQGWLLRAESEKQGWSGVHPPEQEQTWRLCFRPWDCSCCFPCAHGWFTFEFIEVEGSEGSDCSVRFNVFLHGIAHVIAPNSFHVFVSSNQVLFNLWHMSSFLLQPVVSMQVIPVTCYSCTSLWRVSGIMALLAVRSFKWHSLSDLSGLWRPFWWWDRVVCVFLWKRGRGKSAVTCAASLRLLQYQVGLGHNYPRQQLIICFCWWF